MKKLLTILLILVTSTGYTQDTIKLPDQVAKMIVKDLVSYDSLKAVHTLTIQQLMLTEQKVSVQDSIITLYNQEILDYTKQIRAEQQKTELWQGQFTVAAKNYKRLKARATFTRITLAGTIGFLGYLYITK